MNRVAWWVVCLFALVSFASGGTISGTYKGGSASAPNHGPAVVWLEGGATAAVSRVRPVMAQHGGQFVPNFLVVVAGQTVDMPNEDNVAHNVYSVSATKSFNLGYYAKEEHKEVTFDRVGMADILCVIHSYMRGRILVVPNSNFAMVAADGSFRIRNVPPGNYNLKLWDEGFSSFHESVTVPPGNMPVRVNIPRVAADEGK